MAAKLTLPPSGLLSAAQMHSSLQVIPNRYLDDEKLIEILKQRFGSAYRLRYKCRNWYLSAPAWLDDETLQSCEMKYL